MDADRQFFKSSRGLPEPWASRRETPLSHSFCQHVVLRAAPLVVEDARLDPLVSENGAIEDLGVIAYAGYPITSADGEVLGSLCAIDDKPRAWSAAELDVLRELASLAHTELELRAALRDADAAATAAERASAERAAVIESSSDGIYTVDLAGSLHPRQPRRLRHPRLRAATSCSARTCTSWCTITMRTARIFPRPSARSTRRSAKAARYAWTTR